MMTKTQPNCNIYVPYFLCGMFKHSAVRIPFQRATFSSTCFTRRTSGYCMEILRIVKKFPLSCNKFLCLLLKTLLVLSLLMLQELRPTFDRSLILHKGWWILDSRCIHWWHFCCWLLTCHSVTSISCWRRSPGDKNCAALSPVPAHGTCSS